MSTHVFISCSSQLMWSWVLETKNNNLTKNENNVFSLFSCKIVPLTFTMFEQTLLFTYPV
jgi:hypothetical protein